MRRTPLFTSPLFLSRPRDTGDLRAELTRILLDEAETAAGVQRSNVGGWHSEPDLFTRPGPAFAALQRLLFSEFREALQLQAQARGRTVHPELRIGGQAWAMVMESGHYSVPHHHGDAHWACVFYVDAGELPADPKTPTGMLTFLDPRGPLKGEDPLELFETRQDLRPKDGLLVFFPGWLQHHVHPYAGDRPRVSISANLVVG